MEMKPPHFLLRYLVEGVLIFGSVYGAFLLEDYRAKSEQKKIFIKRWDGLINSISSDSLKFTGLLYDGNGFRSGVDMHKWVDQDSIVLANYDHLIDIGTIHSVIEVLRSFRYWSLSYTEEPPYYQDIIENHPDHYLDLCSENSQLCDWLDLYYQYHRRIDRYNRFTREMHLDFWRKISDSYPIPEVATNRSDSLAIARDFRSRNYLMGRYKHSRIMTLPTIKAIVELNKKMSPTLQAFDLDQIGVN